MNLIWISCFANLCTQTIYQFPLNPASTASSGLNVSWVMPFPSPRFLLPKSTYSSDLKATKSTLGYELPYMPLFHPAQKVLGLLVTSAMQRWQFLALCT